MKGEHFSPWKNNSLLSLDIYDEIKSLGLLNFWSGTLISCTFLYSPFEASSCWRAAQLESLFGTTWTFVAAFLSIVEISYHILCIWLSVKGAGSGRKSPQWGQKQKEKLERSLHPFPLFPNQKGNILVGVGLSCISSPKTSLTKSQFNHLCCW